MIAVDKMRSALLLSPKHTGWKPSPLFLVPAPKSKDWVFFGVSAVDG